MIRSDLIDVDVKTSLYMADGRSFTPPHGQSNSAPIALFAPPSFILFVVARYWQIQCNLVEMHRLRVQTAPVLGYDCSRFRFV